MIYSLTAIGYPAGGSSAVHIYTQTIHRRTQTIHRTTQKWLGKSSPKFVWDSECLQHTLLACLSNNSAHTKNPWRCISRFSIKSTRRFCRPSIRAVCVRWKRDQIFVLQLLHGRSVYSGRVFDKQVFIHDKKSHNGWALSGSNWR
jgi:hypothetical protein